MKKYGLKIAPFFASLATPLACFFPIFPFSLVMTTPIPLGYLLSLFRLKMSTDGNNAPFAHPWQRLWHLLNFILVGTPKNWQILLMSAIFEAVRSYASHILYVKNISKIPPICLTWSRLWFLVEFQNGTNMKAHFIPRRLALVPSKSVNKHSYRGSPKKHQNFLHFPP